MDLHRLDPDSYGSPYGEQLKRGFRGLRFGAILEKEFREFYVGQNLPRARLSGLIALILVLAVTCIDLLLGPDNGGMLNTLRLGILCPLLVVLGVARKEHDCERLALRLCQDRLRREDAGAEQPQDRSPVRHALRFPTGPEILRGNRFGAALFRARRGRSIIGRP